MSKEHITVKPSDLTFFNDNKRRPPLLQCLFNGVEKRAMDLSCAEKNINEDEKRQRQTHKGKNGRIRDGILKGKCTGLHV